MIVFAGLLAAATLEMNNHELEQAARYSLFVSRDMSVDSRYPMRQDLLRGAEKWSPVFRKNAKDFFLSNLEYQNLYSGMVIENFSSAPNFRIRRRGSTGVGRPALNNTTDLRSLSSLLQQSYSEMLPKWEMYVEGFEKAQPIGGRFSQIKLQINSFLGVSKDETNTLLLLNPYHPPYTGHSCNLGNKTRLLVVGPWPTEEAATMNVAHEFSHVPLKNILLGDSTIKRAIDRSECAYANITDTNGYDTWEAYLLEAMVRAISYRIPNAIEHRSDFKYEDFWFEAFDNVGKEQSFTDVVKEHLSKLAKRYCKK